MRLWLVASLGVLAACEGRTAPSTGPSSSALPEVAVSARRPTRRYYLARVDDHCAIFSKDGDQVSSPVTTPCPPDLLSGEKIRIAGKTCTRESSEKARELPVVCPDPLTNEEKKDLAKQTAP